MDFIADGKAHFFPVGVPGLFRQYNAPADFVETTNTIGLPRYAKQAVDQEFGRWVTLKKRFDIDSVAKKWIDRLPSLVTASWPDEKEEK